MPKTLTPSSMPGPLKTLLCLTAVLVLQACGTPPAPARLHRLASAPPAGAVLSTAPVATGAVPLVQSATAGDAVWQLVTPLQLPQYLDRDPLLTTRGSSGLQPMAGERWAEPLRDAVPRVLVSDLSRLRGMPVWSLPVPGGAAVPVRQLRVELLAFEASADRRMVLLQARWWLSSRADSPLAPPVPRLRQVSIETPITGTGADALVDAHRLALWQLAERIVATP